MDKFIWQPEDIRIVKKMGSSSDKEAVLGDLTAWRKKAIKAVKDGKPANVKFVSGTIPEGEQERIRAALGAAKTVGEVVKVFATPLELKAADADTLIDSEWDAAKDWARKAMEG